MLLNLLHALDWWRQPPVSAYTQSIPGGSGWDAGSGEVWREGKRVKAHKVARVGISAQYVPRTAASVRVRAVSTILRSQAGHGHANTNAARALRTATMAMAVTTQSGGAVAHSCNKSHATSMIVSSYNGACATLGMDEILALLNTR